MINRMDVDNCFSRMGLTFMGHLRMGLCMAMGDIFTVQEAITKGKSGITLRKAEVSSSTKIRVILMLESG